ncbi:MAG: hypothetical protein K5871_08405 [Lachnospiraceae bacterium]|nr:hypothetical protein [Lachnospiraceae bacterium]MBP1584656.1 hypothetical protein [Lachnospiraceae bacterium]MCR4792758.1 hypothetical protein [Lachnospiraceae bacterium]
MNSVFGMSLINALVICLALPLIGIVVEFICAYLFRKLTPVGAYFLVYNYLTIPGVMWHELSHALFAFVTLAKVNKIELFKPRNGSLGRVNFTPRGPYLLRCLQLSLASCAPVITGLLAAFGYMHLIKSRSFSLPVHIILGYLIICIVLHMTMSIADLKLYFKGIWVFFILFFVCSLFIFKNPDAGLSATYTEWIGSLKETLDTLRQQGHNTYLG